MRHFKLVCAALVCATFCLPAAAQFGFTLPGLGKSGSDSGKGLNINNLVSGVKNLTDATKEIGEPEEIKIGQNFAAMLLGAKPLAQDARLQQYVNGLGRWLALQTERPDLPWTFGVLEDPGFNAFATPGGIIFVTTGLIARMRNEAELAGVLAHEMGHVLKKHHLAAVKKNASVALLGDVMAISGRGGNEQAKAALFNFGRKLYSSGLDQGDEFEADRLGVVIAARAGYDAYGLPAVLQSLQAQSGDDANYALMFKTHPLPAARIEALDRVMKTQFDGMAAASGRPLAERLKEYSR